MNLFYLMMHVLRYIVIYTVYIHIRVPLPQGTRLTRPTNFIANLYILSQIINCNVPCGYINYLFNSFWSRHRKVGYIIFNIYSNKNCIVPFYSWQRESLYERPGKSLCIIRKTDPWERFISFYYELVRIVAGLVQAPLRYSYFVGFRTPSVPSRPCY